ncbi:hypothetical protein GCM10022414_37970 [Zhongshania borealis]|uniref:Uncharacterized protein n=1 Tax=Zhongshania borealis TaxID=889488 RepID=A0ABP7XAM0_9GAMM
MSISNIIYSVEINCGGEGIYINNSISPEINKVLLPWSKVGALKILISTDNNWVEFYLPVKGENRRCVVPWDPRFSEIAKRSTGIEEKVWKG